MDPSINIYRCDISVGDGVVISVVIAIDRKLRHKKYFQRWVVIFLQGAPELRNSELFKQNISHNLIICDSGVDLT